MEHQQQLFIIVRITVSIGWFIFDFYFLLTVLTYQNGTKVVDKIISGNGGCPYDKSWCRDTPKLHFAQFLTAATLVGIGYPIAAVLLSTLYSKIIGPFPQVKNV